MAESNGSKKIHFRYLHIYNFFFFHLALIKDSDEILIMELLEVLIYAILYHRRAYPEAIFQKKLLYSTSVFTTNYPPLQEYIKNILSSALKLLKDDNKLRSVCVQFAEEERESAYAPCVAPWRTKVNPLRVYERYTFALYDVHQLVNVKTNYQSFSEFEEKIRSCLHGLQSKCKNLLSLPDRFTISIKLNTTESGYCKLADDPKHQVDYGKISFYNQ